MFRKKMIAMVVASAFGSGMALPLTSYAADEDLAKKIEALSQELAALKKQVMANEDKAAKAVVTVGESRAAGGTARSGITLVESKALGSVEVYGRLYPEYTVASIKGATAKAAASAATMGAAPTGSIDPPGRNSIDATNSRLGFKGKRDIGDGWAGVWQVEAKVSVDDGSNGTLGTRDSFVGLKSPFGTVTLGNITTVYKDNREPIRALAGAESGNTVSASNLLASTPWSATSTFHQRKANSIRFNSEPLLGGLVLQAQYSPDEARVGNLNAYLTSFGFKYVNGPLWATLSYENHNDMFGGSGSKLPAAIANATTGAGDIHSQDTAVRGVVAYTYGAERVSLTLSQIKYAESGTRVAGKFDSFKSSPMEIAWAHQWAPKWRSVAAYVSADAGSCALTGGKVCNTAGLDGKMIILGASYNLIKDTELFAFYTNIKNGAAAMFNNTPNKLTVDPGASVTNISLGMTYDF